MFLHTQAIADSCRPYAPYLKKYSAELIAHDFPYVYLVAQVHKESNCRFVISYDGVGSESPAQITWKWWSGYLKAYGVYNLKTIPNFTKAQVLIMKRMIEKAYAAGNKKLWIPFQAYNGGWLVLKEIERSGGSLEQSTVKKYCRRKTIRFKNGQTRSACDINYEYPVKIEKFSISIYHDMKEKTTTWEMW